MKPMPTMRVGVLTAAIQDIVSREERNANPLSAVFAWLDLGKEMGLDCLQVAAALHPDDHYIPPAAMIDKLADHLPLRTDLSDADASLIVEKSQETGVQIHDLGIFENLLHPDDAIRTKVQDHLKRGAEAAFKLKPAGCTGVAGFVGRNFTLPMDANLIWFEDQVIPILKLYKQLGLKYRIEQCPMPGLDPEVWYMNIAYCAGMWIEIYKICKKHGVEDVLEITYDESHDILMGSSHHGTFSVLKQAGIPHIIGEFHGKDQVVNPLAVAMWTQRGQMAGRGDYPNGVLSPDAATRCNGWKVMPCEHGMIGLVHYNPAAMARKHQVDWLDHQLQARRILGLDMAKVVHILEHEWQGNRVQNVQRVKEMIMISARFIRGVDQAAAANFAAEQWCAENTLTMPGKPNEMLLVA